MNAHMNKQYIFIHLVFKWEERFQLVKFEKRIGPLVWNIDNLKDIAHHKKKQKKK